MERDSDSNLHLVHATGFTPVVTDLRPSVKVKIPLDKPGFQRRIRFGELGSCQLPSRWRKANRNDCIHKCYQTGFELERRDADFAFVGMDLLTSRSVVVPNRRV